MEGNSSAVVVVEGSGGVVGIVVGLAGVPYIVAQLSTYSTKVEGEGEEECEGKEDNWRG